MSNERHEDVRSSIYYLSVASDVHIYYYVAYPLNITHAPHRTTPHN